jgi:hypothetical protein
MATRLLKDIQRETLRVTDTKQNLQIVTLRAGDMLEFRSKGKRLRYEVPLQSCYYMALIYTCQQLHKAKMAKYLEDKKNGLRTRRPRPLSPIFNPKLYEALRMRLS